MISNLSEKEAIELLSNAKLGRLGCISNGEPYVVPVNFVYDGESIFIHSLHGKKIISMRENPRVCVQVDDIESDFNWKSVIVFGRYKEIKNEEEIASTMSLLLQKFPSLTPVETYIVESAGTPLPIVFRIEIEKITSLCHR